MPVWARKFYISKIVEFKQEEQKQHNQATKKSKGIRR